MNRTREHTQQGLTHIATNKKKLPEGWEWKELGDFLSLEYGKPLKKEERDNDGKYPVYGANGVKSRSNEYYYDKPSIIVGRKGSAGEVRLAGKKFWPLDVTYYVKYNENECDRIFIYHLLKKLQLQKLAKGVKPGINRNDVYSMSVALPPLSEQKRIVAVLDEAFAAIDKAKANAEKNLANARELFESYLKQVFEKGDENWERKSLYELGTITSSKRIYKSEYVQNGIPFYRTKEIKEISKGRPISIELFISIQRYNEIKKSFGVPQIKDLLMSAVGTIGEILVIENNDEFYFKDGNIIWFKDFNSINTYYLKYALTAFVEKIKNLAIGSAYNALTIEKLNKYIISFPKSVEEQESIVNRIDSLSNETKKIESIYQSKLSTLDELKKSILKNAFEGEL